jgi:hypothetical protein
MKNIDHEVRSTLSSLDGIERAGAGPYFYTRLEQKLRNRQESVYYGKLMPVLAVALVLFLIINVLSLFGTAGRGNANEAGSGLDGFATEYNLSENEVF